MKALEVALLFVAVAMLQPVKAIDRLCVNADNIINKLYVDGKDMTAALVTRRDLTKCDCIEIPPNSGVIAVQATNWKGAYGIQSCDTSHAAVVQGWRCRPINKAKSPNWYKPTYDDSTWKPSKGYTCEKHCHQYYRTPCPISYSKCHWSNHFANTVRCRATRCADDCTSCAINGPGTCDPGKCRLGEGTNAVTGKTVCKRECQLCIKTWGQTVAGSGSIKVKDILTNYVDVWELNTPGDYLATIDMSSCKITNKLFAPWIANNNNLAPNTINNAWKSDLNYTDLIGIEVAVGPSNPPTNVDAGIFNSNAPYYAVWKLIHDNPLQVYYGNEEGAGICATLFGVKNAPVVISDVSQTP